MPFSILCVQVVLVTINSAIAEFIPTSILGWYRVVPGSLLTIRTIWYQPKVPVAMNSAIAEFNLKRHGGGERVGKWTNYWAT